MTDRIATEQPFDLGAWRVSPALGLLVARESGAQVRLEPQLMALLLLFAGSDGAVLSKERIIAAVWGGRAIGDDTLAAAVSRLRTALSAEGRERYIETLPKRGYRLTATLGQTGALRSAEPEPGGSASRLVTDGQALLRAGSPAGLAQARLYFEAAIRADPTAAAAQAGLAETLLAQHAAGQGAPAQAAIDLLKAAYASASAAVGLDPDCASGWASLGFAQLVLERDFASADRALLRATALAPRAASPLRYRAFALAVVGRFAEAERSLREALRLDPLSLAARNDLVQTLLVARRFRPAAAEAKAFIDLAAGAAEAWYALGWAQVMQGASAEGARALLRGLALWGADDATIRALDETFAAGGLGNLCAAGADLFENQHLVFKPRPTDIAILRALAGQTDLAFAALEAATERMDPALLLLERFPWFDPLRGDRRWASLVERARVAV